MAEPSRDKEEQSVKEHVTIVFPEGEEALRSALQQVTDELHMRAYNNAYLKQLLILKDKKIQLFKEELDKSRATVPTFNDLHYKHIYTLVDKLHEAEEQLAHLKNQLTDSENESKLKDKQIEQNSSLHTQIEYNTKKIKQLLKYLRNSRAQIRQLSNEKELAEENAASLTQQLNEIKAKYALISASATGKVIDRQREFTLENKELRERLVMNKLQISELKAAKASVEEDLESLQEQLQYTQKTLANQTELIQMRFEKDKSTIKSLTDENQRVNQLLQQLQVENMTLQGKVASFSDQLTNLQSKFDTLTKEKEIVENGKSLLEERIEQLARERDQDAQEIRLLTRRVECANENLLSARKEMIFKDACIRSLQAQSKTFDNPHLATHSLDKLTIDGVHLEGNKKKKNLSPHSQEQFVQHKLLESLNAELAEVREALSAHQAHSAFLQSDLSRIEREKNMELDIKQETIARLTQELFEYKRIVKELRANHANLDNISPSPSYSPAIKRREKTDVKRDYDLEELRSELEVLKQYYFRSLALGIKLQIVNEANISVNIDDLYEEMPKNLPVADWPKWVETSFLRLASPKPPTAPVPRRKRSLSDSRGRVHSLEQ